MGGGGGGVAEGGGVRVAGLGGEGGGGRGGGGVGKVGQILSALNKMESASAKTRIGVSPGSQTFVGVRGRTITPLEPSASTF